MPGGDTDYTFHAPGPDYLVRGRAQTVRMPVYRSGALVAPTAIGSAYELFGPAEDLDDGTPLISGAVTVASSVALYAIGATALDDEEYGRGWVEVWTLVLPDGSTRKIHRPACIVRSPLYPVITDTDIDPTGSLARHRASTLTSWQAHIDSAWLSMLCRLEEIARWPELIWTPYSFRRVHLRATKCEIYSDFARSQGGKWLELLDSEEKQLAFAWRDLSALLDRDQDGHADEQTAAGLQHGVIHGSYTPHRGLGFGGLF